MAVLTRRETGPFPYYPERNLAAEACEAGIPIFENPRMEEATAHPALRNERPDLLLVASFHQKLSAGWIDVATWGAINIHPSLLPAYRGATPTVWCLIHGEPETGVTAHRLSDEVDGGPIILQRRVPIAWEDTDGSLRWKLARVAERLVQELVERLRRGERLPAVPQDETRQSRFPKRTMADANVRFDQATAAVYNRIRANLPYPGPYAWLRDRQIRILAAEPVPSRAGPEAPGTVLRVTGDVVEIGTLDGAVRVWVRPPRTGADPPGA